MDLTQEKLKETLHYDANTGVFTWLTSNNKKIKAGNVAGYKNPQGYVRITIEGKRYQAHRLAWLYVYGELPKDQIDHINHIPEDNRIVNLREVTNQENGKNQIIRSNNKSGVMGVFRHKLTGKWQARIKVNGKDKHLGLFDDFEDATRARKLAEIEHGYHENHGKTALAQNKE